MQFPFTGQMWFALRQWLPTCSVVPLTSKSQQEATGGEVRSSVELETKMEAFFNREHSQAANRLFSFTSHNTSDRQLAASALPGWGTVNFRHFSRVLIACSSLLSGVKWKAYCLKQQQPFSLWISVKMKHELFQSILVLPLAHCPRNPSSGLQITVSNLCPSLIKITWAHSVFRNDEIRPFKHCSTSLRARGEGTEVDSDDRGSDSGKASMPFPWRETVTRRCHKNMQCFQCFLLDALPAHYPFKCSCCFCLSPWAPWLTVHLVFWLTCSRCLWPCVKRTTETPLNCHLLWTMRSSMVIFFFFSQWSQCVMYDIWLL